MIAFGVYIQMDDEGQQCGIVIQIGGSQCLCGTTEQAKDIAADLPTRRDDWNEIEMECFKMVQTMVDAASLTFDRITKPAAVQ